MVKVKIFNNVPPEWWNDLVKSVAEGTIYQTDYWGNYLKNSGKGRPYYLAFYNNSETPICILLICFENNWHKFKNIPRFVKNKSNFTYASWINGPLILQNGLSYAILQQIICEIEKICIKNNTIAIRNVTLPLEYGTMENKYNDFENILMKNNSFYYKEWKTAFIDLSLGKETIWNSFKAGTRQDVNRAKRDNLKVAELEKADLGSYSHILAENMRRNKMIMPPHYPDDKMWEALKCNGYEALRVLSVKKNDILLGALGLIEYNGIIFQIGTAQSNDTYLNKLNVNDLIKWEAISWGADNNKRIYDLTGVAPVPSNEKEEGIKRYKLKWSNSIITYNTYSKVYKRNLHRFLTVSNKIYNTIAGWI